MNRRRPRGRVALRRLAPALLLAALAAAALAAPARAGTFRVSQCNGTAYQADLWFVQGGWPNVDCTAGGRGIAIIVPNFRLAAHGAVSTFFGLPARMPGSSLRTLLLDWRFNPQAPSTNPAFLHLASGGALVLVARPGEGSSPGAPTRLDLPGGTRGFEAQVWCSPVNGPGWCNWPGPLLDIRGIAVDVEEHGEPGAAASGPLTAAGEHAGIEPLELTASDGDSGVRTVAVSIAGTPVGTVRGDCRGDRLPPCPQSLRATLDVDTRTVPDGKRRLRLVVTDAAGNARTVDAGTVEIRNQPIVPPGPPPPGGSAGPTPGGSPVPVAGARPLFPANPLAGRGHVANGSNASERARLDAWLEPAGRRNGRPIRRRTATVPPGVRVRIRGRLTTPRGRPIGRATLAAIRREDGGPWKTITGVRTRPNGRFTAFTRIGPSQQAVQFVYYAFGDSRAGRHGPRLHVRVRRE